MLCLMARVGIVYFSHSAPNNFTPKMSCREVNFCWCSLVCLCMFDGRICDVNVSIWNLLIVLAQSTHYRISLSSIMHWAGAVRQSRMFGCIGCLWHGPHCATIIRSICLGWLGDSVPCTFSLTSQCRCEIRSGWLLMSLFLRCQRSPVDCVDLLIDSLKPFICNGLLLISGLLPTETNIDKLATWLTTLVIVTLSATVHCSVLLSLFVVLARFGFAPVVTGMTVELLTLVFRAEYVLAVDKIIKMIIVKMALR